MSKPSDKEYHDVTGNGSGKSCPSCPTTGQNVPNPPSTGKKPNTGKPKAKNAPNPKKSKQPRPQAPKAVCPRCGSLYKIDKPIQFCKECELELGAKDEYGDMDWNDSMKVPFPDFVNSNYAPDVIFAKTIKWYYDRFVKQHKRNPSHRLGKVQRKKAKA